MSHANWKTIQRIDMTDLLNGPKDLLNIYVQLTHLCNYTCASADILKQAQLQWDAALTRRAFQVRVMDLLQNFFGVSWYPILKLPYHRGSTTTASRRSKKVVLFLQCGSATYIGTDEVFFKALGLLNGMAAITSDASSYNISIV
ncbi:unnamed protein product [Trichogramma brassicae]|uniref:Uncharacterized protein n=1 Tax=Trichogramma brassicae TaxID=86971 RepID=A0A6H5J326_9HYME|nr:unnamed protein product [Trichogramma brassicae]